MSEEYDLKKSEKIGQLYPVLLDVKGNVIDGFHRLDADRNWRTEQLKHIDTEEKLLLARCVANWHRRAVSREEKEEWINGLARIYQKQGLEVRHILGSTRTNEIVDKIVQVTGLDVTTVRDYISAEFKQMEIGRTVQEPRVPASQVIEKAFPSMDYGKKLVERHREEVERELRPRIEREVRETIIEEEIKPKVKEELSRDAEFIKEVIKEGLEETLPTLPPKVIDEEGFHIPTIIEEQVRKAQELMEQAHRELEEKHMKPGAKERGELVKNWMAHVDVVGVAGCLRCPICGAPSENLVWKCHAMTVLEALKVIKSKLEGKE